MNRLPSSSRAYPFSLEKKAEAYRRVFERVDLLWRKEFLLNYFIFVILYISLRSIERVINQILIVCNYER